LEERRPLARAPAGYDRGGSLVCGDDDEPVDVAASDFGKDCNAEVSSHPPAADTRNQSAAPREARIRVHRLVPYQAVVGARETTSDTVSLRLRNGLTLDPMPTREALDRVIIVTAGLSLEL